MLISPPVDTVASIIIYSLRVFHWSLSHSKSLQISWSLLCILAVLKKAVVWLVSTCPIISKSSSPFNNPLVTLPKAPITIGIIVTFMFHSCFQFPCKEEVLILLFTFPQFYSVISQSTILQVLSLSLSLSFVDYFQRLSDQFVCQSPIEVYVSHSQGHAALYIYHLFVWSNLNFLHISRCITLSTQSCLILLLLLFTLWEFFISALPDGFSLKFEWQQSPQLSSTLLSINIVLNNVVVWMVSSRPLISKSSSPFNNPFVTVSKAPILIGIIVTFMFHRFFNSLARSRYFSFFSLSFSFNLCSAGTAKSTGFFFASSLFFIFFLFFSFFFFFFCWLL